MERAPLGMESGPAILQHLHFVGYIHPVLIPKIRILQITGQLSVSKISFKENFLYQLPIIAKPTTTHLWCKTAIIIYYCYYLSWFWGFTGFS